MLPSSVFPHGHLALAGYFSLFNFLFSVSPARLTVVGIVIYIEYMRATAIFYSAANDKIFFLIYLFIKQFNLALTNKISV